MEITSWPFGTRRVPTMRGTVTRSALRRCASPISAPHEVHDNALVGAGLAPPSEAAPPSSVGDPRVAPTPEEYSKAGVSLPHAGHLYVSSPSGISSASSTVSS